MPVELRHHATNTTSALSMYATAFVYDDAGRILLIRENYGQRRYGPPGGAVDEGESPQDAAVREALEEVGVTVAVRHLIGIRWATRDGERFLGFGFLCDLVDGTPHIPDPGEIAEVGWFDPAQLPSPATHMLRAFALPALRGERGLVTAEER